jgi:nitrilase
MGLRVAAVQAAPVWMDREATVEKAVGLVKQAASEGAQVAAFPETFIPGYPWWVSTDDVDLTVLDQTMARQSLYLRNGVDITRGDLDPVIAACRESECFVSVGIAELAPTGGSVFCSMVMIDPVKGVVGVHRKIKPTYTERIAWADGDAHGLRVHDWAGWKIGGLNCWENWLPLPRFALYSQGEQLHIATWPGAVRLTADITRFVAIEAGMYVMSVSGLMSADRIPENYPGAESLGKAITSLSEMTGNGGTMIVDPAGVVLAEAKEHREEIIYAELDIDATVAARMMRDQGGHYHRPDLFELNVDRSRQVPVTFED